MTKLSNADRLIRRLKLAPHPEGGHFRETWRDGPGGDARAYSTAIYFLLKRGEASHWHRVDAAEIWHWYRGAALDLWIAGAGQKPKKHVLGGKIENGEQPQIVVPPGAWQAARSRGAYTLAGCTVAPGFEFSKFELAPPDFVPGSQPSKI